MAQIFTRYAARGGVRLLLVQLVLVAPVALGQAGWLRTNGGCSVWSEQVRAGETVTWTGACADGRADGRGAASWRWPGQGAQSVERFEGEMRDGMLHRGVFVYANGDRYEGGFVDNLKSGHGVYATAGGDRYEGQFAVDRLHGRGTMAWSDGRGYEGEFEHGAINGHGVFTWSDQRRFEGRFVNGAPDGFGQCRNRDGEWGDCEFDGGEFLGWR